MKMKKFDAPLKHSDSGDPVSAPEAPDTSVASSNITCSYGIHRGKFPIVGMKVKDARIVLKKLIKVDDKAAAVINGAAVDEDTVITSEVTMLSFVKPSAVKGGETITFHDKHVKMDGKKIGVEAFCGLVSKNTVSGMHDDPIPDNVKWVVRSGALTVYILELKPELRMVRWVNEKKGRSIASAKGDENGYEQRKLATPYVVMSVPFTNGQLHSQVELFYRNGPLTSLDDPLFMCNLLNVSMGSRVEGHSGFKTWVCTQYLNTGGCKGTTDILNEIVSHVFGGGFNRSSDACEGASGFSTYEASHSDERVRNVDRWEKESEKNPRFVLDVDWIKAKATPRDLIQFRMRQFGMAQAPADAKAIGNIMLASKLLKS